MTEAAANKFNTFFSLTAVEWLPPDAQEPRLHFRSGYTCLVIVYDPARKKACFRLRLAIFLKGDHKPSNVYLLLNANRMSAVESITDIPEHVASMFDEDVTGVRLKLGKLGGLVLLPPDVNLVPNDKSSADTLRVLDSIAHAPAITFYVPSKQLTSAHVASLCTIPQHESWDKNLVWLGKPYGRRPGKTIESANFSLSTELMADEAGLTAGEPAHPPPELPDEHVAKRRKLGSSTQTEKSRKTAKEGFNDVVGKLGEKIRFRIEESEARIMAKLEEPMEEFRQKFNERLDRMDASPVEAEHVADTRADEVMSEAKVEVHDWAAGKMRNVADQILREITEAKSTMNVE